MGEWKNFYGEDPERSADYSRIINGDHFDRLDSMLEKTKGKILGGRRNRASRFFEPTIVANVDLDDSLMKEEIFGPILPVITWKDESDLARVISLHPDPLAFYIFTERRDFSDRLLKGYSFGGACVNHIALHLGCPDLPFGGRKTSGVGQYHGRYGFDAFTHYKGVVEASSMFDVRLKYPPYGKIDGFLKWFYL
jgi:aldehyde dehydrogenase (NAD+)